MNIRDALSSLTFDLDLEDDEMVTDAIILDRVTRMSDGRSSFAQAGSDGIDTIVKTGLIECGRQVSEGGWEELGE